MFNKKNFRRGLMAAGALALAVGGATGAVALKQKREDEKKKEQQMSHGHPMALPYSGPRL